MAHKFWEVAFTGKVRQVQELMGSRAAYSSREVGPDSNARLRERERAFIQARDSFYIATVSETGWPYLQHRGGPAGFLKVLDHATLGFADYSGNRQYVTTGNAAGNNRVALFLMDYPNRSRLKLLGRLEFVGLDEGSVMALLEDDGYRAPVERGVVIHVEAFDWNCPKHITPRYSEPEVEQLLESLREENRLLRCELNRVGVGHEKPRS